MTETHQYLRQVPTQFLFGHASKVKQMISVWPDTLWNVTQQFLQSIGCTHAHEDIVINERFNNPLRRSGCSTAAATTSSTRPMDRRSPLEKISETDLPRM